MADKPPSVSGAKSRSVAAQALKGIVVDGLSSDQAFSTLDASDHSKALVLNTLRTLLPLQRIVLSCLDKPISAKDQSVFYLMIIGGYELLLDARADHASVNECAAATVLLKRRSMQGLVNAVLRTIQKQRAELKRYLSACSPEDYFPGWMKKRVKRAWKKHAPTILAESRKRAPLWLSVNDSKVSAKDYQARLTNQKLKLAGHPAQPRAIQLFDELVKVPELPGFNDAAFYVQDRAAQLSGDLLPLAQSNHVMDACTAPGGKLVQLLLRDQREGLSLTLEAVDISSKRLQRVEENLARMQLTSSIQSGALRLQQADLAQLIPERGPAPGAAQNGPNGRERAFDAILLDAPCSATGVVRRRPDIPFTRKPADIAELVGLQQAILHNLWQRLKPGGHLLYATCSILPEENSQQMEAFCDRNANASALELPDHYGGIAQQYGRQWLPGEDHLYNEPDSQPEALGGQKPADRSILAASAGIDGARPAVSFDSDGFYYCLLKKSETPNTTRCE